MTPIQVAAKLARLAVGKSRQNDPSKLATITRAAQLAVSDAVREGEYAPVTIVLAVVEADPAGATGLDLVARFRAVVAAFRGAGYCVPLTHGVPR
jgi:hypothetical protein